MQGIGTKESFSQASEKTVVTVACSLSSQYMMILNPLACYRTALFCGEHDGVAFRSPALLGTERRVCSLLLLTRSLS